MKCTHVHVLIILMLFCHKSFKVYFVASLGVSLTPTCSRLTCPLGLWQPINVKAAMKCPLVLTPTRSCVSLVGNGPLPHHYAVVGLKNNLELKWEMYFFHVLLYISGFLYAPRYFNSIHYVPCLVDFCIYNGNCKFIQKSISMC